MNREITVHMAKEKIKNNMKTKLESIKKAHVINIKLLILIINMK
jgi:hypothetical protein